MIEKEFEVKVVKVRAFCECGGEFRPTGLTLMAFPPMYDYRCDKCNMQKHFNKQYPSIEYREVE